MDVKKSMERRRAHACAEAIGVSLDQIIKQIKARSRAPVHLQNRYMIVWLMRYAWSDPPMGTRQIARGVGYVDGPAAVYPLDRMADLEQAKCQSVRKAIARAQCAYSGAEAPCDFTKLNVEEMIAALGIENLGLVGVRNGSNGRLAPYKERRQLDEITHEMNLKAGHWSRMISLQTIVVWIPELPPTLNSGRLIKGKRHGLKRMHYRVYAQERARWELFVASAISMCPKYFDPSRRSLSVLDRLPLKRCAVSFQRRVRYTSPPDHDNIASSFKLPGDALVTAKVIVDDNCEVIVSFDSGAVQVKTLEEQGVCITITAVDDA